MDLATARQRAQVLLRGIERPDVPLMLDPHMDPIVRSWCYAFYWNSVRYLDSGDFLSYVAGNGPVVVPTDGSEPFFLKTYGPPEELLDEFERHGLPDEG